MANRAKHPELSPSDYAMLLSFRCTLREFLQFSEKAAEHIGVAPQQYQALLAIKGIPERERITINEMAEKLMIRHNSAVGLVNRMEKEGLVKRYPSLEDRRQVHVMLTSRGMRIFEKLAAAHREELNRIGPQLRSFSLHFSRNAAARASRTARQSSGGRRHSR
ncbi:MAG: MarR family winged helix-turn-helix transcriptional regulator [Burkholderiales bacterium]